MRARVKARPLSGGRTGYTVVDRNGKFHAMGWSRQAKADAERIAATLNERARLAQFGIEDDAPSHWTLAELFGRVIAWARVHRPGSLRERKRILGQLLSDLGDIPIDEITEGTIDSYATNRKRKRGRGPVSARTINLDLGYLRTSLALARRWKRESCYRKDPFAGWEAPKGTARVGIALAPADVRRIIAIADRIASTVNLLQDRLRQSADIVAILAMTGSRISQVMGMRRDWISDDRLTFPGHKRGKERVFVLDDELRRRIVPHLKNGPYLFGETPEAPRRSIRRFWRTVAREAGFPDLHPNDLRHTAITQKISSGGVRAGQRLGGHQTARMAQEIYDHAAETTLRAVKYHARAVPAKPAKGAKKRKDRNG